MVAILSGKNPTGVMIFLPSPNTLPAQGGAVVGAAGVDGVHVCHQNLAENTFKADADIWDGRASPLWSSEKFIQNCAKNKQITLQSPQTLPWSTSGQKCSSHSPSNDQSGCELDKQTNKKLQKTKYLASLYISLIRFTWVTALTDCITCVAE